MIGEILPEVSLEITQILAEKRSPITILPWMRWQLRRGMYSFTVYRIKEPLNRLCRFGYQGVVWIPTPNDATYLDLRNKDTEVEYCFRP
jgi:hypothetical protein